MQVAKTKALISCAVNAQLICTFIFCIGSGFLMPWLIGLQGIISKGNRHLNCMKYFFSGNII